MTQAGWENQAQDLCLEKQIRAETYKRCKITTHLMMWLSSQGLRSSNQTLSQTLKNRFQGKTYLSDH
jgi:hypothetical protein